VGFKKADKKTFIFLTNIHQQSMNHQFNIGTTTAAMATETKYL
jgi:hypothetical protein